jgi:CIC family chloride channel protein
MLGASVGSFEHHFFPHLTGSIGSYALVGMGVLFAAFLRAPLTSVFMVLEVSGNYSIVLPVILANTVAYLIARSFQPVPILEIFTHQDGLDLPSMEEQREESNLRLEDAMHPVSVPVLQGSETIGAVAEALARYGDTKNGQAILVHCSDGLWYAAAGREIESIVGGTAPDPAIHLPDAAVTQPLGAEASDANATLEQRLGPERTPVLFPDLPLASALPHRHQPRRARRARRRRVHGRCAGALSAALATILLSF